MWIAIKDKLPEVGVGVLITNGVIVTAAQRDTLFDDRINWDGHEYGGYEWDFDFDENSITHWMSLPDPPN